MRNFRTIVATVLAAALSPTIAMAGMAEGRDRMPVVLTGADLGPWVNTKDLKQIYLYRYESASSPKWVPIPFQIDKRREVNILHSVGTREEVEGLQEEVRDGCVLSYFRPKPEYCSTWVDDPLNPLDPIRNCPETYDIPFSSDILSPTDEVVFMARDLGWERDTCAFDWLADDPLNPGSLQTERLEIMVIDDGNKDGAISNDEKFWVYAFLWTSPPPASQVSNAPAPTWVQDQPDCGSICSGQQADNNEFNEHCGTVTTNSSASIEGLKVHWRSNWEVDDFSVIDPGSTSPEQDVIQILGYKAVSGSTTETTNNWDCNALPRPLGVKPASTGQVRVVRGVQGAQSGAATRKYDRVYDSYFEREVELRVHELTSLEAKQGQNDRVKDDSNAAVWPENLVTSTQKNFDAVDGSTPTNNDTDPKFGDWTQFMENHEGGTASYGFADPSRGPVEATGRSYFYSDTSLPWGEFGHAWSGLSCMQDGIDNNGGCGSDDPEGDNLRFKRLIQVMIPMQGRDQTNPDFVKADDWEFAVLNPAKWGGAEVQQQQQSCGGTPPPLCTPSLSMQLGSDGPVDLSMSAGSGECDPSLSGFGLTRQVGSEAERIIAHVDASGTYKDKMVLYGVTHTYRAYAFDSDGRVSAKSTAVNGTPADTQAPPAPSGVVATPIDSGASVDFETCSSLDEYAANAYVSTTSGGPYSQVNSQPILLWDSRPYTVAGLQNGVTYYLVMTVVDHRGNESVYSSEVVVTPSSSP